MEKPKVHHYSTSLGGGAGLACIRGIKHIQELKEFNQKIFTLEPKKYKIPPIEKGPWAKLKIFFNKVFARLFVIRNQRYEIFDFGDGFYSKSEDCDITHIHWVTQFLNIKNFIRPNGKYVWTLHDLAPLTGGCHYFWDCSQFQRACMDCPQTRLNSLHQRAHKNLARKLEIFHQKNAQLKIIATSEYSFQAAKASALVQSSENIDVVKIPYGIDTKVFTPYEKTAVRQELGLDPHLFTICFGAENLNSYRKGGDLFIKVLERLAKQELELQIVTFGEGDFSSLNLPFQVHAMGTTFDEQRVAKIYSSANLFLALSRQEAFGQTAQESLSCGAPVLCFENTGFADQVIHQRNGFIVPMADITQTLEAIVSLCESQSLQNEFQQHARDHILATYEKSIIAKKYAELYRQLL